MEHNNKILVIGDIILDQYYSGVVSRVSPEAPVPVIKLEEQSKVMGGAANVVNNVSSLGNETSLMGIVGQDDAGKYIESLLNEKRIDIVPLHISNTFNTLTKIRIIGNKQQIARLDCHDDERPSNKDIDQMIEKFNDIVEDFSVVIVSDYSKGVCTERLCKTVIDECKKLNITVIVDPKGNDWSKYCGATFITPNLKEISEYIAMAVNNTDEDIEEKCLTLPEKLGIENLLITRSEKGMTLINRNGIRHFPSKAKEVYDVSGAGDTVVAVLAAFIHNTTDIAEAINMANVGAGIVVGKRGTATVTLDEINNEIEINKNDRVINKIVNIETLMNKIETWKRNNETIIFTNGCYDIFHKGHVFSIYSAAEFGNHLIVAINSDASVKRLKGPERPINNQFDRAYVMASLGCVDAVIIFDEDTPEKILSMIQPDVLVKGGDYKFHEVIGRQFAKRVELINYIDGYSTTNLISKMSDK